jgi:hypothetical protein
LGFWRGGWRLEFGVWCFVVLVLWCFGVLVFWRSGCLCLLGVALLGVFGVLAACLCSVAWDGLGMYLLSAKDLSLSNALQSLLFSSLPHCTRNSCQHAIGELQDIALVKYGTKSSSVCNCHLSNSALISWSLCHIPRTSASPLPQSSTTQVACSIFRLGYGLLPGASEDGLAFDMQVACWRP